MSNTTAKAQNTRAYICEAITVVLLFAGFFIHGGPLPDYGWKVLFIFIGLLFGWSTVGLIIPSLLGLLALGVASGDTTVLKQWTAGFGGNVICLIVLFSIMSKWLEKVGLIFTIMNWFMSRKIFKGKPWVFIAAFFAVIYFLAFLVDIFPAIFIGLACIDEICSKVGVEKRTTLMGFLVVNLFAISAMGSYCKPWSAWALVGFQALDTAVPGATIDFLAFFVWTNVVYIVSLVFMVLIAKFLLRIDASAFSGFDYSAGGEGNLSSAVSNYTFDRTQKFAAVFMAVLIILLFIPSYLPGGPVKTILNSQMGVVGITVAAVGILGLFRGKDGNALFDFKKMAAANAIPWDPIMLLAVTVPLGSALQSQAAGIMPLVSAFVQANMGGMSAFAFYAATALFLGLMTQVAHNLVLLMSISPIFCLIGNSLGFSPALIIMISTVVLAASLGTPAASTRAGMLFGESEFVTTGDCYKFGWLSSATMIVACLIVGVPLALALGL